MEDGGGFDGEYTLERPLTSIIASDHTYAVHWSAVHYRLPKRLFFCSRVSFVCQLRHIVPARALASFFAAAVIHRHCCPGQSLTYGVPSH